jgi:hypothetical protein
MTDSWSLNVPHRHPDGPADLLITVAVAADGALVAYLDTPGWTPDPQHLRVNVNDGPAFNYSDAPRWYGEDVGIPAPTALDETDDPYPTED